MTRYAVGFEVAGLLLTVALVGAIALAHREEGRAGCPEAGLTASRRGKPPPADMASTGASHSRLNVLAQRVTSCRYRRTGPGRSLEIQ